MDRADWLTAEPDVRNMALMLIEQGARRALDLGCGVGRHSLLLSSLGFEVLALDGSPAGVDYTRRVTREAGYDLDIRIGPMTDLPYEPESFDYVLAWNVIYHGDENVVRRCIEEIYRVLRPKGLFQGTMLSKRNSRYGRGREIAPNTFIHADESDKRHPHYYCSAKELIHLFESFEIWSLNDREHKRAGSYHWSLTAERI